MKIIAGLTGPTGSGKSTVCAEAVKMGIDVIDCDKVARMAVEKGTSGLAAVIDSFGTSVLNDDGTLNRAALAKAAFCDKEHTELLNKTLLPHIAEMINGMIKGEKTLLDAPTLFESGVNNLCSKTIAVLAEKEIRKQRIISRDNLDEQSALLRINAGKEDDFYRQKADYIVNNNDDINVTRAQIKNILKEIFERN